MKNKGFAVVIALLSFLTLCTSCAKNGGNDMKIDDTQNVLESDYVYMWHKDGIGGIENRMAFQSENYSLITDARTGKITAYGIPDGDDFIEADVDTLSPVETVLELKIEDKYVKTADISTANRIIDSGRYVNRYDNISLRFSGYGNKYIARTEYVATSFYTAFNYQIFAPETTSYSLRSSFTLSQYEFTEVLNGRGVQAIDSEGSGLVFLKQTEDDTLDFTIQDDTLVMSKTVDAVQNEFHGFGVMIIPVKQNDTTNVDRFLTNEKLIIKAKTTGGETLNVNYDSTDGIHYIDVTPIYAGTQSIEVNRTNYDIAEFEVENNQNVDTKVNLCFLKTGNLSITGVSPMMRDIDTKEPTGEQVQISKNWHTFKVGPDSTDGMAEIDSPKRLYQGPWLHAYTSLDVKKNSSEKREFLCAYGQWGSVYAAAHGQLCLIGWGADQVWDQSSLGSWGESVTYDPDICLGRARIDDVRPFLVTAPTGGNQMFYWSGNVGGADFLNYIEESEQRIVNQKITYKTQAPNLTNVNYSGITENGKIKTDITINLGRTDDVVRNYYTVKYTFMEDVEYGRLSLFKIAADGYADNYFTNYAYGDENGAIVSDASATSVANGYVENKPMTANGDNFWFGLYNSSNADEYGDVMMTVRSYNAKINGKKYTKPGFNLFGTSNGYPQMSCEITVPNGVGKNIKKGSEIEFVVEYTIVPNNATTYYGESDYLLQTTSLMGTADSLYQQVVGGTVNVNATKGKVISNYPVAVCAESEEGIVAEFAISGGLGYVPVTITNLNGYKGYKLQVQKGDSWENVNQAVRGNDFWQTYLNKKTGKYELTFNVKNISGLDFGDTKVYRLIKE